MKDKTNISAARFNIVNIYGVITHTNLQRSTWHKGYDWDHLGHTGHISDDTLALSDLKAVEI